MPAVETTGVVDSKRRTYVAGAANMLRGTVAMQGADDNHVIPATAGAQGVGIIEESVPNAGDPISIVTEGEAVAICGAAVAAPAYLMSNGAGQLIPSTAIGDQVIARAVSSASTAGDYFVARITPFIR